jgi:hypothetical protein
LGKPVSFPASSTGQSAAWDEKSLNLRVLTQDSNINALRAAAKSRDGKLWTDDSAELFLSPDRVTSPYLQLIVNSAGVWYDGVGDAVGTSATEWDASPDITIDESSDAWIVALRLSWKDLHGAPSKAGGVWAIHLRRWRSASGVAEYDVWSGAAQAGTTHRPEAFGDLRFQ